MQFYAGLDVSLKAGKSVYRCSLAELVEALVREDDMLYACVHALLEALGAMEA